MDIPESLRLVDLTIVLVALFGSLGMGCALARTNRDTDSFFMAGRSMPGWAVGLSLMATMVSSMTFLALPAYSYKSDWRWAATCLVYPIALIPAIRWFMPFFRQGHVNSAYEYFEQRFGSWARVYVALGFILMQWLRMGIILYATSLALEVMLGIDRVTLIVVIGLVVVAYCTIGGLKAVIWTDVAQGIGLMLGGLLVIPIVCLRLPGGAEQLVAESVTQGKTSLGAQHFLPQELGFWSILVSHLVIYAQLSCTDQMFVQRYCAPRSLSEARKTIYVGMLLTVPVWMYFIVVGTALWAFYQHYPDPVVAASSPEAVFPRFIATQIPMGLCGLLAAAVILASMSTLSSSINAVAATVETDLYRRFLNRSASERHYLTVGRTVTFAMGMLMIGAAIAVHAMRNAPLIELQAIMMGIFGSGLLGLFLLGFTTKSSNRSAAVATGVTLTFVIAWLGFSQVEPYRAWWPHELWLAVIANLMLFVIGSSGDRIFQLFQRNSAHSLSKESIE